MPKSARGKGSGKGRTRGSKNKRTKELEERMAEMLPGWDPVTWMAKIAADGTDPMLYEPMARLVLLLEGCRGKTANDTRKIRQGIAMIEQIVSLGGAGLENRVACAKEVANYLWPKRKAIEVDVDANQVPVRVEQYFGPTHCPHCKKPLK